MDDYSHCFMAYLNTLPALTLSLPSLPLAITHTLSALSCPAPEIIRISLDVLAKLSDLLQSHPQGPSALGPAFHQYGKGIISIILAGVVQNFPEDSMEEVEKVLLGTVSVAGGESEEWAKEGLASVPGHVIPQADRLAFLQELHE
jgi:transportin-3